MQLRTSRRRLPFPSRCWAMRERGLAALTLQLIDTSLARTVPSHHAPRYLALTSSPTVSSSSPLAGTAEASGALIPPPPQSRTKTPLSEARRRTRSVHTLYTFGQGGHAEHLINPPELRETVPNPITASNLQLGV